MLFLLTGCLLITEEEQKEWSKNHPNEYFIVPPAITPATDIFVGTELSCSATAEDDDGSSLTPAYRWLNGETELSTESTYTPTAEEVGVGDAIRCVATITSQNEQSIQLEAAVTLENTLPEFTSGASISPSDSIYTGTELTCSAEGLDANDGELTVEYEWISDGSSLGTGASYTVSTATIDTGADISCIASITDENDASETSEASVTVENSLPSISVPEISPSTEVYNDSVLTCSASGEDADEELTVEYVWKKNGAQIATGDTIDLGANGILPAQNISCEASVTDADGEQASESASVTVENRNPTVDSVFISNQTPEAEDSLSCTATASDIDGEQPTLSYSWEVNGNIVGVSSFLTLDPSFAPVGESLVCIATATDGYNGSGDSSTSVVIQNTEPTITQAAITPAQAATTTSQITCSAAGDDLNDGAITPAYTWTNGSAQIGTGASLQLDPSLAMPGDTVTCTAEVTDSSGSTASSSTTKNIQNSYPEFTNSATISPNTGVYTNTELTCSATIDDPEDGSLTPFFTWKLNGSEVDVGSTYTILAENTDVGDVISCTASVEDSHGAEESSNTFVTIENSAPTITDTTISMEEPFNDDTVSCSATAADIDEDVTPSYTWSSYGITLHVGQSFDLSGAGLLPSDDLTCTATVADNLGETASEAVSTTIGNRAPTAPEVSISWSGPASSELYAGSPDDLTCVAEGSIDEDGEQLTYSYAWTSDAGGSVNGSVLSSVETSESETWTCIATVTDQVGGTNDAQQDMLIQTQEFITYTPNWLNCTPQDSVRLVTEAQYRFLGENPYDDTGMTVAWAGDVDGDGLDDFLIDSEENDDGGSNSGKVYLIFGSSLGANSTIDLSLADYSFVGEYEDDEVGYSLASAGDVDGDGLDDILIGTRENDDGGGDAGKAYLILASSLGSNSTIDLANADYSFVGENEVDKLGFSVSSAGDIDDDGLDDILIGARFNDDLEFNAGKVYLILGSTLQGSNSNFNMAEADYTFLGHIYRSEAGFGVKSAADFNGDGRPDIVISAPDYISEAIAGEVYIILSSSLGNPGTSMSLADADYTLIGENVADTAGRSIDTGDIDGDGLSDLIIGASDYSGHIDDGGKVYVVLGSSLGSQSTIDLANADYYFLGENEGDDLGASVAFAGDVDGDGLDDMLMGATDNDDGGDNAGKVYLVLASSLGVTAEFDLSQADFSFTGENDDDEMGLRVSSAGDVNGDGLSDILLPVKDHTNISGFSAGIVGLFTGCSPNTAPELPELRFSNVKSTEDIVCEIETPATDAEGQAISYSFFWEIGEGAYTFPYSGATTTHHPGDTLPVSAADSAEDIVCRVQASDGFSSSLTSISMETDAYTIYGDSVLRVANAGDVDGDGLDDILVGAHANDDGGNNAGKVYLFFAASLGSDSELDVSQADYTFVGENAEDQAGFSLSTAGDVDGDGLDDILISAINNDDGGTDAGKTYIILAASLGINSTINLANADYAFIGEAAGDFSGYSIAGGGNIDGDQFADIMIGAYAHYGNGVFRTGKIYFIRGSSLGSSSEIDLSTVTEYVLGESSDDQLGTALAFAGDVDGDGLSDMLMGAYGNDQAAGNAGKVYLMSASIFTVGHNLLASDYIFTGEAGTNYAGIGLASAGDVDGDGKDDILIGASGNSSGGADAGRAYLILSSSLQPGTTSLSQASYIFTGESSGDYVGYLSSFSGVGDVDDDGLDDILIGAHNNDDEGTDYGKAYLILSNSLGSLSHYDLSDFEEVYTGNGENALLGYSVAGNLDINGDGINEFMFASPNELVERSSTSGACYIRGFRQ